MMYVILLGGPGAGKGTQSVGLSSELGAAHVASGDLFRRALGEGTTLGIEAKSYMDKGELVPDELTVRMVLERLQEPDCGVGPYWTDSPAPWARPRRWTRPLMRWARRSGRFYISRSRRKSSYGGSAADGSAGTASPPIIWSILHPRARVSATVAAVNSTRGTTTLRPHPADGYRSTTIRPRRSSRTIRGKARSLRSMESSR